MVDDSVKIRCEFRRLVPRHGCRVDDSLRRWTIGKSGCDGGSHDGRSARHAQARKSINQPNLPRPMPRRAKPSWRWTGLPARSNARRFGQVAQPELSLQDMSRIMEVASTLRKERTSAQQQLNLDETKALLRERLLETTKVTGDGSHPPKSTGRSNNTTTICIRSRNRPGVSR